MSDVTSESELTTKEIVEQAISDYHNAILPYLAKGNNGYSETPIGAIQLFDDDTAPSGWLVADGTVYNIDDYPFLANHYERVHGSKNHYGGDGITTFAVPDWQGEFFRASGPNAHPNQGDGGAVGEHQDATEQANIGTGSSGANQYIFATGTFWNGVQNPDSQKDSTFDSIVSAPKTTRTLSNMGSYTSRPTCTSGLCCIKAVPAGINYSLEEQEIGTWMDEKLYKKTIDCGTLIDGVTSIPTGIENIEKIIQIYGIRLGTDVGPIPNGEPSSYEWSIGVWWNIDNTINIRALNYTGQKAYVTLEYTKTTD